MVTVLSEIECKLTESSSIVFTTADFLSIAGRSAVTRALNKLINECKLMKISIGLYAKARKNRINGQVMLDSLGGADAVLVEALDKLGIKYEKDKSYFAYINGESTQIPAKLIIKTSSKRKFFIGQRSRLVV